MACAVMCRLDVVTATRVPGVAATMPPTCVRVAMGCHCIRTGPTSGPERLLPVRLHLGGAPVGCLLQHAKARVQLRVLVLCCNRWLDAEPSSSLVCPARVHHTSSEYYLVQARMGLSGWLRRPA